MTNLLPFEKRKPKILHKYEEKSNYGKDPKERTIEELQENGIIILNKPAGPTSHQVAEYVKNILNAKKAGHGGTLDPGVSGVLPIALNKATRMSLYLLTAGKEYVCLMHLHKEISDEKLNKALEKFTGKIRQLPPLKSAVKREERTREIYYVEILERKEKDVLLKIGCQAGTYIRKFVHDLGRNLNCGAHMQQLVRSKAGPFSEKEWVTLQDITDAKETQNLKKIIHPIEDATAHLKKVWISDGAVNPVCHGANINVPGIVKVEHDIQEEDLVSVFTLKNELVCVGVARMSSEQMIEKKKGKAITSRTVFMDADYFPRLQKSSPFIIL